MAKNKRYKSKVTVALKKGDHGQVVKDLQDAANVIIEAHRFPWRKVIEDADLGPATFTGVHFAGWLFGLSRKELRQIKSGTISVRVQKLLRREKAKGINRKRIDRKRKKRVDRLRKLHFDVDPDGDGLAVFEGMTVAAWIKPWLEKARDNGWVGRVTSGWRSPEYSQSLCYAMCGAPSCPGKCAGLSSNHVGKGSKDGDPGAVDVSDYDNFGQIMRRLGAPLKNALGSADPVHFSASGH